MKINGRDRGATLPIVALVLPVLIIMVGFAVDLGRLRSSRRTMQARADIVALDMVRLADGRSEFAILNGAASDPIFVGTGGYAQYLLASATRNDVPVSQLQVVWGTWTNASGFVSCGTPPGTPPPQSATTCYPDAVEVTAKESTTYYFQPGSGNVTRVAVAAVGDPEAAFTIGSFAARINTSGSTVLALASQLTGLSSATTLVGYNGLASSRIALGPFLTELGVASTDDVATTSVTMAGMYLAAANVLSQSTSSTDLANASLLFGMVNQGVPNRSFQLGQLLNIAPGGGGAALDSSVNALDLLTAGAQLANGTSGAELNNLALALPGLTNVQADLDIIQPPQLISGPVNTQGRTDQVSTVIDATILNGTGLSTIAGSAIRITAGAAAGIGRISSISCATNPESFVAAAATSILDTTVKVFVTILGLPVTIIVTKNPPDPNELVTFTRTDDPTDPDPQTFTPDPKVVGQTNTFGLSGSSATVQVTGTVGVLQQALFNSLLNPILSAVTGPLLTNVVDPSLAPIVAQLGLNIAGADLRPQAVSCDGSSGLRLVG